MLRVHSNEVTPGDTFLALRGINNDGHNYINEAINKGATCIIAQEGDYPVKTIIEKDTRAYLAKYLNELYADKLKKIELIAIGGVNGKTSAAYLTYQLLNKLEHKCAYIGSLGFCLDDNVKNLKNTTPDLYELYELISEAVNEECEYLVIEVSEAAMLQRRLEGLKFKYVAITNTSTNVLNMANNINIALLNKLKRYGYAIINADDEAANSLQLERNQNILFGMHKCDYQISDVHLYEDHSIFKLIDANKMTEINLPLAGKFNIYNYLVAYIIAVLIGVKAEEIILTTSYLKAPDGRYQIFKNDDSTVIVDNADTVERIKAVVTKTKKDFSGKLLILYGGNGNLEPENLQMLGKEILDFSDYTVFTINNPYHEKPEDIIQNMTNGLDESKFEIVVDRKEAIKKAISILAPGDVLLVLGRGNAPYQFIDNEKLPFNDVDEVSKFTKNKNV